MTSLSDQTRKRRPRHIVPLLDKALAGTRDAEEWMNDAAGFLTKLESLLLAGEASIPIGMMRDLDNLLRDRAGQTGPTSVTATVSKQTIYT